MRRQGRVLLGAHGVAASTAYLRPGDVRARADQPIAAFVGDAQALRETALRFHIAPQLGERARPAPIREHLSQSGASFLRPRERELRDADSVFWRTERERAVDLERPPPFLHRMTADARVNVDELIASAVGRGSIAELDGRPLRKRSSIVKYGP